MPRDLIDEVAEAIEKHLEDNVEADDLWRVQIASVLRERFEVQEHGYAGFGCAVVSWGRALVDRASIPEWSPPVAPKPTVAEAAIDKALEGAEDVINDAISDRLDWYEKIARAFHVVREARRAALAEEAKR